MIKSLAAALVLLSFLISPILSAQEEVSPLDSTRANIVQLSGILVAGDSLAPVQFATVAINEGYKGTITDNMGFFTLAVRLGDRVEFSSIGYQTMAYTIPDSLLANRYSIIQVMRADTIALPTTVIYPFPTREKFKEEFLALALQDDAIERARKNMDPDEIYNDMLEMGMSPQESYKYVVSQRSDKLYYNNQTPPIQVLNPIAWAQFIQAWKRGDFKKKGS